MQSRNRRSVRTQLGLESLEQRRCFNVDLSVVGSTLFVVGDDTDNHVAIAETSEGLQVQIENSTPRQFGGIASVVFEGRSGNDALAFSWGMRRAINLTARLGDGADSFNANINNVNPSALPPGPCRVTVLGEGGSDRIETRLGTPDGARATEFRNELVFNFDGGDGNDFIQTIAENVRLSGPTSINTQGGAGNDTVLLSADSLVIGGRFASGGGGGAGDDYVGLIDPTAGDGITNPPANIIVDGGQAVIRLNGEGGNDRVMGQAAPQVHASSNLDIFFSGDEGSDAVTMLLYGDRSTRDEGTLNASALGGSGNDLLFMMAKNQTEALSTRHYVLDGGEGFDSYYGAPLIPAINVEKKL